jgi:hypothetical protein
MHADVRFFQLDVVRQELPIHDVVMCSLFLHHLGDGEAVEFLRSMGGSARRMVLVNDLTRTRAGLVLAYFGGRFLAGSHVNRIDSIRSVGAAFTIAEAHRLAQQAGLTGAIIEKKWPCRFLLSWEHQERNNQSAGG